MGIGIITVTPRAFADILGVPDDHPYRLADTPLDTVRSALRMPDGYTVVGVHIDFVRLVYLIGVESASLPDVPIGQLLPEVTPTYTRDADGSVRLLDIAVYTPDDYRPWHPVPLPE